MDSLTQNLPERLQKLTKSKYFPIVAVVIFAFITAFVFAIIAFQSQSPTVDDLREQIYDRNGTTSRSSLPAADASRSVFDRVIDAITGRKPVSQTGDGRNGTSGGQNDGSTPNSTGGSRTPVKSVPVLSDGAEILKKIEKDAIPLPKVSVGKYVLKTQLPDAPQSAKIHKLRTSFTEVDVRTMAGNLGMLPFEDPAVVVDKNSTVYQIYDLQNNLFLSFDLKNGSYIFIADNGVAAAPNGFLPGDARDTAEAFMIQSGLMQDCLQTTAAYESSTEPGTTIVEMRCSWDYLGAPFLNTIGVLNLGEGIPLSSVRLGDAASENPNGFAGDEEDFGQRGADDFNTVLVKVKNNKVVHVGSNIPVIESTDSVGQENIIQPNLALAALNLGNTELSLSTPTGAGYIELPKVYPNGIASVDEANVNDFMLAYTTIPGFDQQYLCPVWISRSDGIMSSGYNGLFVSTLKAVSDPRCATSNVPGATGSTPPAASRASASSAQGFTGNTTGNTSTTGTTQLSPTGPAPTVVTGSAGSIKLDDLVFEFTDTPALGCPEAETFTNAQVLDAEKGIYMMWKASNQRTWYIVFTKQQGETQDLDSTSGKLTDAARKDYLRKRISYVTKCKPRTSTSVCPLPPEFTGGNSLKESIVSCVKLTTGSPSLYVYSRTAQNMKVTVSPFGGVGFADPVLVNSTWNILALPGNGFGGAYAGSALSEPTEASQLEFALPGQTVTKHRAYYEFRKLILLDKLDEYLARNMQSRTMGSGIGSNDTAGRVDTSALNGVTIRYAELESFLEDEFAPTAGLSEVQTRDLIAEVKRETQAAKPGADQDSYVKVALLPNDFVNTYLPVSIEPTPQAFDRYVLYFEHEVDGASALTAANGSAYDQSLAAFKNAISPVSKSDLTVVELGVLVRP